MSLSPFPLPTNPCFLRNFFQGCPNLFVCHPLAPPCLSPVTAPFIARLACTYFKYKSQSNPLFHGFLLSPYVGRLRLCSCRFPHYFLPGNIPCPVRYPSHYLPHDMAQKTRVCYLYLPLHCHRKYPSLSSKN